MEVVYLGSRSSPASTTSCLVTRSSSRKQSGDTGARALRHEDASLLHTTPDGLPSLNAWCPSPRIRTRGMQLVDDTHSLQLELQGLDARSKARSAQLSAMAAQQHEIRRFVRATADLQIPALAAQEAAAAAAAQQQQQQQQQQLRSSWRRPPSNANSEAASHLASSTEQLARSFWEATGRFPASSLVTTPGSNQSEETSASDSPVEHEGGSAHSSHRNSRLWAAAAAATAAAMEDRRSNRMFNRLEQWRAGTIPRPNIISSAQQEEMAEQLLSATTTTIANKVAEACCICLETMLLGEDVRMLGCTHRLHGHCLRRWLLGKAAAVCPLCKHTSTSPLPPQQQARHQDP